MVEHSRWGATGFIINRPLRSQVGGDKNMTNTLAEGLGGPVQVDETISHIVADSARVSGARRVLDGVWWSETDRLDDLGEQPSGLSYLRVRGYAGWAPRQLEMEIERGSWRIFTNTTQAIVFSDPLKLWGKLAMALDEEEDMNKRHPRPTTGRWLYFAEEMGKHLSNIIAKLASS
jgi:putative AlgH/UPF0301 family transcriptional regulator